MVDYKMGIKFEKNTDFSYKLVNHILGMANAGGGFIVIGYPEDENGKPCPSPSLDEGVLKSYDISDVAQYVERFTSGTDKVDIQIHKDQNPNNNITYPIIEVKGFKKRPFFCKSTIKNILKENTLYIRIESARTVEIASPDDWEKLIDICVEKRQDEQLSRFTELMKEMGLKVVLGGSRVEIQKTKRKPEPTELSELKTDDQKKPISHDTNPVKEVVPIHEKYTEALSMATSAGFQYEGIEIIHQIVGQIIPKSYKELFAIAEKSVLRNTGWPIGIVTFSEEHKPKPDKDGLRCVIGDKGHNFDYWFFNFIGGYYFFRTFGEDTREDRPKRMDEDERILYFDTRIWRISEGVKHCIEIYKNMGLDPKTIISLEVNHLGIKNRQLTASNPERAFSMFKKKCIAQDAKWSREMSLDLLITNYKEVIFSICRELFILFDMWEPDERVLESVLGEFELRT